MRRLLLTLRLGLGLGLGLGLWLPAQAASVQDLLRPLQRAHESVLGVRSIAIEDAPSVASLGANREGSGVVIGVDGLVVTVGYLVLEAQQVELIDDQDRRWPARVVAYDVATGLALLKPLTPMQKPAVPLGHSLDHPQEQPMMMVSGGPQGEVGWTELIARRSYSGSWEYHIEGALYVAPARTDHSGAGLFNQAGELLGIGSLVVPLVGNQTRPRQNVNVFVPVDLLRSALKDMREQGRSAASHRAWLGMHCTETVSGLRVIRINDDSPADVAGLVAGDRVERIDGRPVRALGDLWQALWSGGPAERTVVLDIVRDGERMSVPVYTVDRMKVLKRPEGV
jgi:serine protease Do